MIDTSTLSGHPGTARGDEAIVPFLVLAMECQRPNAPSQRFCISPDRATSVSVGRGPERAHEWNRASRTLRVDTPDRWMSSRHAELCLRGASWVARDLGSKNGTRVNGVRIDEVALRDGDLIEAGSTLFVYRECALVDQELALVVDDSDARTAGSLRTMHVPLELDFDVVRRVAAADVPVMISGATGTGKELIARAIHALSGRSGAFTAVNCGALAPTLVESELFGHKKGAFSGATENRPGLIRASDKGTLFLDEIAELPAPAQVTLLRALQEREVRPIGASAPVAVDFRVVTATHRDLAKLVDDGLFRADLFSRLAGFSMHLPPLNARPEDIGMLARALLVRLAPDRIERLRFHPEAARTLFRHHWPLNVRELEQALRVALAVATGDEIEPTHLPESIRDVAETNDSQPATAERLEALLREHNGNVSAVARAMATSRAQIRRLAKRFDVDLTAYRGD